VLPRAADSSESGDRAAVVQRPADPGMKKPIEVRRRLNDRTAIYIDPRLTAMRWPLAHPLLGGGQSSLHRGRSDEKQGRLDEVHEPPGEDEMVSEPKAALSIVARGHFKGLLREIGLALYGSSWEAGMASQFDLTTRVIRRWHDGTTPIPDQVWPRLCGQLRLRQLVLEELLDRLPK